MPNGSSDLYEFGPFRLDVRRRTLAREEQAIALAPKTFELLVLMVRNSGRALSKQELMTALWPDTFVEETNLSFQISTLRKALGEAGAPFIETVPKHGYRFGSQVSAVAEPEAEAIPRDHFPGTIPPEPPGPDRPTGKRWLAVGTASAALAVASYIALGSKQVPASTLHPGAPTPLTAYVGFENTPSLSPDGNQVAFSWNGPTQDNFDVYVKLVGPGEPLRLTSDLAGDGSPAWSPDGRQIAFLRFHSEISADVFIVPALGGAERKLATISLRGHRMEIGSRLGWFADLSWSPDGKWIAFGGGPSDDHPRGIWLIGVDRSEVRQLTESGPNDTGDWWPTFSPDGRYLAFVRLRTGNRSAVYVLALTSGRVPAGAPIRITPDTGRAAGLAWTPDSRAVVFSWGGHLNPTHLYRVGLPQAAGSGVSAEPELLPFGERGLSVSISSTGRLVYAAEARDASIWKIPLTGGENPPIPSLIVPSTLNEETPAYSPDGTRLAFASTRSGSEEIWIANADGSKPVQMTSMGGPQCANPQWSPDGRVILFNSRREGSADLYLLNPDGGEIRRITDHPDEEVEPRWSRDGRTIYFGSNRTGRYEVWKMAAAGGPAVRVTSGGGVTATESTDGRFLYYAKGAIAPNAIWRVALAGGKEEPVVDGLSDSTNFAVAERGLYFLAAAGSHPTTSIDFFDFATRTRTTILSVGKRGWYGMAVSPDQRTLLYATIDSQDSNLVLVDGFK